jgi:dihydrofolate reductase
MKIRTHMAVSVDRFVATPDGRPAILTLPDFDPGVSHGFPEFLATTEAVLMGRTTFLPALGQHRWPWGDKQVFVLTSSPLPPGTPDGVRITTAADAGELLERMREARLDGDVHLVGGPSTIRAFREIGALDVLELLVIPAILGEGCRCRRPARHRGRCAWSVTSPVPTASSRSATRSRERAAPWRLARARK